MLHKEIQKLAKEAFNLNPKLKKTTVYILKKDVNKMGKIDNTLNRVGVLPSFIKKESVPEDMRFERCIDYNSMPEIQRPSKNTRITAFFIHKDIDNDDYYDDCLFDEDSVYDDIQLLDFSDDLLDLNKAPNKGEKGFKLAKVNVPVSIFYDNEYRQDDYMKMTKEEIKKLDSDELEQHQSCLEYVSGGKELQNIIEKLRDKLYAKPIYLGGRPMFIQDDAFSGSEFIMQFDDYFMPINLGDAGLMYVSKDDYMWQCH